MTQGAVDVSLDLSRGVLSPCLPVRLALSFLNIVSGGIAGSRGGDVGMFEPLAIIVLLGATVECAQDFSLPQLGNQGWDLVKGEVMRDGRN